MPNSAEQKYKVRIAGGRVLGPLDITRIKALTQKGIFSGNEPCSVHPFESWKPFSSFPELQALIQKKLADERKDLDPNQEEDLNKTKTLILSKEFSYSVPDEAAGEGMDMPTLLDIKRLPEKISPDDDRTIIQDLLSPAKEATKIISQAEIQKIIAKHPPKKSVIAAAAPTKKQILSPRTAMILAVGLVILGFLSQFKSSEEIQEDILDQKPKTAAFPALNVSIPLQIGKIADPRASIELAEEGLPLLDRSTPLELIKAIKENFFPAAQKNPQGLLVRSLLATSFLRLAEVLPRDAFLYETTKKLLFPSPAKENYVPEYVVALAEYYFLLQRFDQAEETLNDYLSKTQTPELLYQKARILMERKDIEGALNFANRAIKASVPEHISPRYHLLLGELLALKKSAAAAQEAKILLTDFPRFGPGLLFNARLRVQANQHKSALKILYTLTQQPLLLDRPHLSEAFLLTARALEMAGKIKNAIQFAETVKLMQSDSTAADNIIYRLRSKSGDDRKSYEIIMAGTKFEQEKNYERAENQYILAREASTGGATPYILWARVLEAKGQPLDAIERLKRALQVNPHSWDAATDLIRLYVRRYDFAEAQKILELMASLRNNSDEVDYWRGRIMMKLGKRPQAELLYRSAITKGSRLPDVYIAMGELETEQKNRELAEYYYAVALRYDPLNSKALLGTAIARFHLESPSRAIAFLKDKLSSQPNSAAIMTSLAVIYRYSGDKDSTKSYLQNAMRSDPTYAEAFRQIGDLAREEAESYSDNYAARENNYRFALASYEGYSKLSPFDPEGYMATAELYFYVRDFGAAAKNYYKLLDLAPNYPGVRLRLARISLNGKDANKALTLVQEELKRYPESAEAFAEMGKIQLAQGIGAQKGGDRMQMDKYLSGAADSFTKSARLSDDNPTAIFFLGYVNLERGNYDNAQTLLERAKKLDPLSPDVHIQLGRVYLRKSYKPKAMEAFTNAKGLTRDPDKLQEIDEAMRGK